jgi:hypothetical protein
MGQNVNYLLGNQQTMLGADPELYRQQLIQQEQARIAALPAQNQLAAQLGTLLGRGVVNVAQDRGFFEVTNPVLQNLTKIQNVYNTAMQSSDPNDPTSFYKNLQEGFAQAGLGQQAMMAAQELRRFQTEDIKTQSAQIDLYGKNPDLLMSDIAKFREQGNDKKANELAGLLGKITLQQDTQRAKDVAELAFTNAKTEAQKAQASRLREEISSNKYDWKIVNDITGAPVSMAKIDKKTGETTYEPIPETAYSRPSAAPAQKPGAPAASYTWKPGQGLVPNK